MGYPGAPRPPKTHAGLRLLALIAVSAGLLLLAAAAFVLSYAGVRAVALSAGVSPHVARFYPVIFDAMLVVACSAVLSLRGAGLPSRCYAWLWLLVLLVVVAFADALHATNVSLPHRPAAAAAAVIPWALVLIGFSLLLVMLRHARLRRARPPATDEEPARSGGLAALGFAPEPPAPPAGFDTIPGLEAEQEAGPQSAARPEPAAEAQPGLVVTAEVEPAAEAEPEPAPDVPSLDRVRSSPVPPES